MTVRKLGYLILRIIWKFARPLTIGVRALLVRDSSVLLVRHTYQDHWYLPGGRVEKRETLEQAIRRELDGEIEATVGGVELFGVCTNFFESKNDHFVVFITSDFTVGESMSDEIETVESFPVDDLRSDISPGSRRRIDEYTQNKRHQFGLW